jgi:two-component system, chemotaxis family, sensor kinase CheA
MVEFDRSAFIGKFQEEATDLLQRLNEGVIMLEAEPGDRPLIEQMLRDAHTLKGSSRMVGLMEISDIAHRLEDIMVKIRDGAYVYTPKFSDFFFEALDTIVYLSESATTGVPEDVDLHALQTRLNVLADTGDADAAAGVSSKASADGAAASKGKAKGKAKTGAAQPATAGASDDRSVSGAADADEGDEGDEDEAEEDLPVRVAARTSATAGGDAGQKRAKGEDRLGAKAQATIRVRTHQLDSLLNMVSEVVISQIKAEQTAVELRGMQNSVNDAWQIWGRIKSTAVEFASDDHFGQFSDDIDALDTMLAEHRRVLSTMAKGYAEDTSRTSTVVGDLQEQGMQLRMLPVSTIFNTFPRAVRDLAKQFKKDVDLIIEGGDTELDKKVLEEINDPLVHIMRNAVDHGIETPEVRRKAGKPEQGTVRMEARQEGDRIVIEISDDGAGIDPERVKSAAVRKGYLSEAEAEAMSDREARYLIFESGLSTAAIITEISGRGVGMDVVRQFVVEKLKGSLDVESEMGHGTRFRLTIPLTLAIIRALMLRVGGREYAIPTASIEETLRVSPEDLLKAEGREVIRRQRRTIPLVRLGDILNVPQEAAANGKIPIAVIGFSGHRMGFIVDSFIGEQQIVIKTLGTHLRRVENVAGVTVLGAGEVVVILNVPDLMDNARSRSGMRTREVRVEKHEGPKQILICEDSFTTRELERSIFEAAGYAVEVAMDGAQGLQKLRSGMQVDALVTDVQMPNMTGFELTKAVKSDPALEHIPVVIVTSLERDEEKAEGIESGADAYITKSVFNQDTLLDTVERLIR